MEWTYKFLKKEGAIMSNDKVKVVCEGNEVEISRTRHLLKTETDNLLALLDAVARREAVKKVEEAICHR